ncbi:YueI family protein [Bacillus changyiensis]|uniref:YueI family protein n=1 Tax=Bacillus changyiensis TaxID=3004103 RepID=UPI0022DECBBD|nr:YueI family protein [Bacillus changyiensis]MDA1476256.1 YueI family protein [Bacillus changyiensis]
MSDQSIDQYLQQGMYGARETKPDERRLFLGSLRERVVIALTKGQVLRPKSYQEVMTAIDSQKNVTLLLNGEIEYSRFSPYIKAANKHGIPFSMVADQQSDSPLGLVLVANEAIEKESIYIQDDIFEQSILKKSK